MHRLFSKMASASSNIPLIYRMVQETCKIVSVSQSIVQQIMQSGRLDVVDKGINDFQTKADRAAQTYIVQQLSALFPKASIIGEEGDIAAEDVEEYVKASSVPDNIGIPQSILSALPPGHLQAVQEEEVVIWVDPLDGTNEFTKGVTEGVTVLVGIATHGKSIAGVIGQPFYADDTKRVTGRTMWGIPGVGFGGITTNAVSKDRRVITTTRSHSTEQVEKALACLAADDIIRVGGAGYKAILLMEGKANAYVFASAGCKKWDSCAPEAVLAAAGGSMTNLTGQNYTYERNVQFLNEGGILATAAGEDHEWYVNKLKECPAM